MANHTMGTARRVAAVLIAASAMGLAACAPEPTGGGGPPTTATETKAVTYSCIQVGPFTPPGTVALPDQTVNMTLTRPYTVTAGSSYSVSLKATVTVRRPAFLDLNIAGVPGNVEMTAGSGAVTSSFTVNAVNHNGATGVNLRWTDVGPVNDNGTPGNTSDDYYVATAELPPHVSTASLTSATITAPGAAGNQTLTAGTFHLVSGSSGFVCTTVGAAPSFTIPIS